MGTITEAHDLGDGLTLYAAYDDAGPDPVPEQGSSWPAAADLPTLRTTVTMPGNGSAIAKVIVIPGQTLPVGGNLGASSPNVRVKLYAGRPTLVQALVEARADVATVVSILLTHLQARRARLLERAVTCAAARAGSPFS